VDHLRVRRSGRAGNWRRLAEDHEACRSARTALPMSGMRPGSTDTARRGRRTGARSRRGCRRCARCAGPAASCPACRRTRCSDQPLDHARRRDKPGSIALNTSRPSSATGSGGDLRVEGPSSRRRRPSRNRPAGRSAHSSRPSTMTATQGALPRPCEHRSFDQVSGIGEFGLWAGAKRFAVDVGHGVKRGVRVEWRGAGAVRAEGGSTLAWTSFVNSSARPRCGAFLRPALSGRRMLTAHAGGASSRGLAGGTPRKVAPCVQPPRATAGHPPIDPPTRYMNRCSPRVSPPAEDHVVHLADVDPRPASRPAVRDRALQVFLHLRASVSASRPLDRLEGCACPRRGGYSPLVEVGRAGRSTPCTAWPSTSTVCPGASPRGRRNSEPIITIVAPKRMLLAMSPFVADAAVRDDGLGRHAGAPLQAADSCQPPVPKAGLQGA